MKRNTTVGLVFKKERISKFQMREIFTHFNTCYYLFQVNFATEQPSLRKTVRWDITVRTGPSIQHSTNVLLEPSIIRPVKTASHPVICVHQASIVKGTVTSSLTISVTQVSSAEVVLTQDALVTSGRWRRLRKARLVTLATKRMIVSVNNKTRLEVSDNPYSNILM